MADVALTIAGSDPSGGAGLQADLKTFHRFGLFGAAVVTLLTVQNTVGVSRVDVMDPRLVVEQTDAVVGDLRPRAAKTGALGDARIIDAVAARARGFGFPLVVDPVMVSKHGQSLLGEEGVQALADLLIPRAFLVTPNLHEARLLTGVAIADEAAAVEAARAILARGARHVVVKGVPGPPNAAVDLLVSPDRVRRYEGPRHTTINLHGSGCVFSAAITAGLAAGQDLEEAVGVAKRFVSAAIRSAPRVGAGVGPLNMHAPIDPA